MINFFFIIRTYFKDSVGIVSSSEKQGPHIL